MEGTAGGSDLGLVPLVLDHPDRNWATIRVLHMHSAHLCTWGGRQFPTLANSTPL